MRRILIVLGFIAVAGVVTLVAQACGGYGNSLVELASDDPQVRAAAIAELRAQGPAGLDQALKQRAAAQRALAAATDAHRDALQKEFLLWSDVVDEVGGARYCTASQLYWYTDFSAAKEAAAAAKKPILALRMMGKLNEEFSCANSRFFRTTLYANSEIAATLRKHFILHWESVRPVPKVTIDFGDGRKLERTLTGNSAHYCLTADGHVLDGLPGLHGPKAFRAWLARMQVLATQVSAAPPDKRGELLTQFHTARLAEIESNWKADLARLDAPEPRSAYLEPVNPPQGQRFAPPAAIAAAQLARPKSNVETPILTGLANRGALPNRMEDLTDDEWQRIAARHQDEAKLDDASIALIRRERPLAADAGRLALTKRIVEDPIIRLVRSLQSSIALDTVRNEYVLHRRLHQWLVEANGQTEVQPLNDRVYAELFLTPHSDPWLGLVAPDTYTGLTNNGVVGQAKN